VGDKILFLEKTELDLCQIMDKKNKFLEVPIINVVRRIISGCIFLFTFHCCTTLAQPRYVFNKLTNKDGLSYSTVHDITQDSSGIIWFATKQGLNKYDSYDIKTYYREDYPGIPSNIFNVLINTTDNTLYMGTDKGLVRYNKSFNNFTALKFEGNDLPSVTSLLETKKKNLIIGTESGYYRYFPKEDIMIKHISLQDENVTSIIEYEEDFYMIGANSGIYVANNDGIITENYNTNNTKSLPSDLISIIYRDKDNDIWIGTIDAGLLNFNHKTKKIQQVKLTQYYLTGSEFIREICEDQSGNLWIGTEIGLFIYNKQTEQILNIQHSLEDSEYYLNDNAIYSLFLSRENIMWVGTYFGGINYTILQNSKRFNHIYPGNDDNELKGKAVNKIFKSSEGILLIATEDGGVCTFNPETKTILEYYQYNTGNGLSSNNIHSICEDKNGNIWFGHFKTGIDIYNLETKTFNNVFPNPDNKQNFTFNSVCSIFSDSKGTLWIGTRENIKTYDFKNRRFVPFKSEQLNNIFIYNIMEDKEGKIWFCTRFNGIISYNPVNDEVIHYMKDTKTDKGLISNKVIASLEDSKGRLWFGTMEGGVNIYFPDKDTFEVISMNNGLPNNTIYGILEDDNQNIWLSSNSGIIKYNHETGGFKNYTLKDGLAQMQFNYNSYFKDDDKTMYFGHIKGLTYFNPRNISDDSSRTYVIFTDFKLFNKSVKIGDKHLLDRHIDDTEYIKLKYSQNVFTIDFVAINYFSAGNNRYYYYLDGFEKDWNDVGNKTSVTYTNLSPGMYTFYVKARNNDGLESTNTKELEIKVLKPWWSSNVAIVIYVSLSIAIFLIFRRATIIREKEKSALKIEKLEKERMKELNHQRINFFTYISHEFKTPLSIIIASIDELLENKDLNAYENEKFGRLKRSAKRLSFLISQLMDFRKIETKHAKLVLQKSDLIQFLKDTCLAFSPMFSKKEINFEFNSNMDSYVNWFDSDKIEKIVTNLISNAIRYTHNQGIIKCEICITDEEALTNHDKNLQIKISDNGEGMNKHQLSLIFSPFHIYHKRIEERIGTGIGLTFVKSLVEYLHGSIEVQSTPCQGTEFTIHLPTNFKKISNVIIIEGKNIHGNRNIDIEHESYASDVIVNVEQEETDKSQYHILIIEDTIDLAEILINHYSKNHKVSFAKNGIEALKLVKQEEPDLIICDIMMPEMNGIELCKNIKSNEETSHIAVIFLTAKISQEDKIEGLKAGAVAYISKPFDFNELDLHIRNLLEIRRKLRKTLFLENALDLDNIKIHDRDKEFIEKATQIIKENIENESFTIEDLASQLGMCNTLVYLKYKKLLNISAKKYLQVLRFKKAIDYMLSTDYNISEIAYEVGFSDPNYFSRAFKKFYKITPTEYKKQLTEKISESSELPAIVNESHTFR